MVGRVREHKFGANLSQLNVDVNLHLWHQFGFYSSTSEIDRFMKLNLNFKKLI